MFGGKPQNAGPWGTLPDENSLIALPRGARAWDLHDPFESPLPDGRCLAAEPGQFPEPAHPAAKGH